MPTLPFAPGILKQLESAGWAIAKTLKYTALFESILHNNASDVRPTDALRLEHVSTYKSQPQALAHSSAVQFWSFVTATAGVKYYVQKVNVSTNTFDFEINI